MSTNAIPAVQFQHVSRYFGAVRAVDDLSLMISDGEFFSLLGPSGSGKTTCLRLIAGFEQPTSGSLQIHGVEAAGLPPFARDVNTVFQDYALFPHMTVGENVAYGLMIKKVPKAERRKQALAMLDLVQLAGLADRKPAQLSGGQRQRVALARALVNRPRVLLLDEPLGALDLKLRQQMQIELKALHQQVGITFIYVTHDQEEALTMSDRLAVFRDGRIEQVGTPAEVYEHPVTPFVARFVGTSNVLSGAAAQELVGGPSMIAVRPEKIRLVAPDAAVGAGDCTALGHVREVLYLGMYTRYQIALEVGGEMTVVAQNLDRGALEVAATRGQAVRLVWEAIHNRPLRSEG